MDGITVVQCIPRDILQLDAYITTCHRAESFFPLLVIIPTIVFMYYLDYGVHYSLTTYVVGA